MTSRRNKIFLYFFILLARNLFCHPRPPRITESRKREKVFFALKTVKKMENATFHVLCEHASVLRMLLLASDELPTNSVQSLNLCSTLRQIPTQHQQTRRKNLNHIIEWTKKQRTKK